MSATHLVITPQGIKKLKNNTKRLHESLIEVEDLFSGEKAIYKIYNSPNKFPLKMKFYFLLTRYPQALLLVSFVLLLGISLIVLGLVSFAKEITKVPAELGIPETLGAIGLAIIIVLSFLALLLECTNKLIVFLALLLPITFLAKKIFVYLLSDPTVPPETATPLTDPLPELSTLAPVLIGIVLLVWSYKRIKRKLDFFRSFELQTQWSIIYP